MANELTITAALSGYKSSAMAAAVSKAISSLLVTMSGNTWVAATQSIATTATALGLGGVTSPGFMIAFNKDPTNFIRLMNGSAGAKVAKLMPGQPALFRWDDTGTPYAIADTGACLLDYLLFSA